MIADWCEILTSVLDRRSRKYFFTIILGMLLGCHRRTVSCRLRAAGVSDDWQDRYYFLQTLGRKAKHVAKQLLHVAVRQSGTDRKCNWLACALGLRMLACVADSTGRHPGGCIRFNFHLHGEAGRFCLPYQKRRGL